MARAAGSSAAIAWVQQAERCTYSDLKQSGDRPSKPRNEGQEDVGGPSAFGGDSQGIASKE